MKTLSIAVLCAASLVLGGVASIGTYRTAIAQTDSGGVGVPDAGLTVSVPDAGSVLPTIPDDPMGEPGATFDAAKTFWQMGGPVFAVFLLLVIAHVVASRTKPVDADGDGKDDPQPKWKSMTWAISTAVGMVGIAVLGVLAGADGASKSTIATAVIAAGALLWSRYNPLKKSVS